MSNDSTPTTSLPIRHLNSDHKTNNNNTIESITPSPKRPPLATTTTTTTTTSRTSTNTNNNEEENNNFNSASISPNRSTIQGTNYSRLYNPIWGVVYDFDSVPYSEQAHKIICYDFVPCCLITEALLLDASKKNDLQTMRRCQRIQIDLLTQIFSSLLHEDRHIIISLTEWYLKFTKRLLSTFTLKDKVSVVLLISFVWLRRNVKKNHNSNYEIKRHPSDMGLSVNMKKIVARIHKICDLVVSLWRSGTKDDILSSSSQEVGLIPHKDWCGSVDLKRFKFRSSDYRPAFTAFDIKPSSLDDFKNCFDEGEEMEEKCQREIWTSLGILLKTAYKTLYSNEINAESFTRYESDGLLWNLKKPWNLFQWEVSKLGDKYIGERFIQKEKSYGAHEGLSSRSFDSTGSTRQTLYENHRIAGLLLITPGKSGKRICSTKDNDCQLLFLERRGFRESIEFDPEGILDDERLREEIILNDPPWNENSLRFKSDLENHRIFADCNALSTLGKVFRRIPYPRRYAPVGGDGWGRIEDVILFYLGELFIKICADYILVEWMNEFLMQLEFLSGFHFNSECLRDINAPRLKKSDHRLRISLSMTGTNEFKRRFKHRDGSYFHPPLNVLTHIDNQTINPAMDRERMRLLGEALRANENNSSAAILEAFLGLKALRELKYP